MKLCYDRGVLFLNDEYDLVPLPQGRNRVQSKWVYYIKYVANGYIELYKVHLVANVFYKLGLFNAKICFPL